MSALPSGGEIINLHIGSAGANIGAAFWQVIAKEHHLVTSNHLRVSRRQARKSKKEQRAKHSKAKSRNIPEQISSNYRYDQILTDAAVNRSSQNLGVFFHETYQRHVPRAIFVDNDPSARYSGLFEPRSPLKHFFRPENFVFGRDGSSGIRSTAISEGIPSARRTLACLTREMELCDSVQGIQMTHHLGGGTGSGLGCVIMQSIKDELSDKVPICPMTLLPTRVDIGKRTNPLEVYNTILSIPELSELTDMSFLMDNEALYDICFRLVAMNEPGWRDLNHLVAATMAGFSSCMRFPSFNLKSPTACRLQFRDIPWILKVPNLPFAIPGFSPLTNRASNAPLGALLLSHLSSNESDSSSEGSSTQSPSLHYCKAGTRMPSTNELCQSLFRPTNIYASFDPLGHHYNSALSVFRGFLNPDDIEQEINYTRLNGPDRYREWSQAIPRNLHCKICPEPDVGLNISVSWAGSSTGIGTIMSSLVDDFEKLSHRKAFIHPYVSAGMEEAEFEEKLELCKDIIDLYDAHYDIAMASQIETYENKRDLGLVPFNWKMKKTSQVMFDTHKMIKLEW